MDILAVKNAQAPAVGVAVERKISPEDANASAVAKTVLFQERQETESPSLEARVRDLSANLLNLAPTEIEQKADDLSDELNQLLNQVNSIRFFAAFPIVEQITGGAQ